MRRTSVWVILFFFGVSFIISGIPAYGKGSKPKTTNDLSIPQIKLHAPASPELQAYLGVQKDSEFTLKQLPAKFVLIEVLNVFCPDCQRNAPQMNRVFNIIENDPSLKSAIKVIGIASGNDQKQLETYVKEFKIKFPVFPDPDNTISKMLGNLSTPGLMICSTNGDVLYIHEGVVEDIDALLGKIQETVHRQ